MESRLCPLFVKLGLRVLLQLVPELAECPKDAAVEAARA
jgi:hypothetical protein